MMFDYLSLRACYSLEKAFLIDYELSQFLLQKKKKKKKLL